MSKESMKTGLKWIIFGGLFIIPFIPFLTFSSFFFPFITSKAFVFRIIVEIILASWIILVFLDPAYRPKRSLVLYSIFGFLAIIGLANFFGESPVKSFWSNFERMEGYVTLLHLGAYFLIAGSVFRELEWKKWWNATLTASAFMGGYALLQLVGSLDINQGGARVDGTFGNASYLAVYVLFHFFLSLFMLVRQKRGSVLKWVYGGLAVLNLFVLYHTATRGAILGVLGGLVIFALLNLRNRESASMRKRSAVVLAGILLLVGGFWVARDTALVQESPVLSRFATITTTELRGGGRSFVWPMAVEGVKDRPLLGWGQENFNYVFQEHYDPEMYRLEPWFDRAHNIFLDWAVAGGLLGLLSYLSLYVTLLYLIWRKPAEETDDKRTRQAGGAFGGDMSYAEKSILTGLTAAYFFHNLFVFDHLISYVLFFSLLAYIHDRYTPTIPRKDNPRGIPQGLSLRIVVGTIAVLLLATLYFVNWKPVSANTALIEALKSIQTREPRVAIENFEKAYEPSLLGRPEIVEQMTANSVSILSSDLPISERNQFFDFAKDAAESLASDFQNDARYQMTVGAFLTRTGQFEEAEEYLLRAQELIPGKQAVYLELGALYLNQDNYEKALAEFERAYNMAPEYEEAKIVYTVGAIYAGERVLEERLISEIDERRFIFDNRILSAYRDIGRISDAREIIERRIELDPENEETYRQMLEQL